MCLCEVRRAEHGERHRHAAFAKVRHPKQATSETHLIYQLRGACGLVVSLARSSAPSLQSKDVQRKGRCSYRKDRVAGLLRLLGLHSDCRVLTDLEIYLESPSDKRSFGICSVRAVFPGLSCCPQHLKWGDRSWILRGTCTSVVEPHQGEHVCT